MLLDLETYQGRRTVHGKINQQRVKGLASLEVTDGVLQVNGCNKAAVNHMCRVMHSHNHMCRVMHMQSHVPCDAQSQSHVPCDAQSQSHVPCDAQSQSHVPCDACNRTACAAKGGQEEGFLVVNGADLRSQNGVHFGHSDALPRSVDRNLQIDIIGCVVKQCYFSRRTWRMASNMEGEYPPDTSVPSPTFRPRSRYARSGIIPLWILHGITMATTVSCSVHVMGDGCVMDV